VSKFGIVITRTALTVATSTTLRPVTSIFTRIINGEIPAHLVHRDETCISFLSINPLAPGHTLVVPIREVDHWTDLADDEAAHLMLVAKRIGRAQQTVFRPERVGLIVAGYEVPHCHVHVVPTRSMRQLDFANAAATVDHEELAKQAGALRDALA
jgi:histidine triad (HIT) family protein